MKKKMVLLLSVVMAVSMTACGSSNTTGTAEATDTTETATEASTETSTEAATDTAGDYSEPLNISVAFWDSETALSSTDDAMRKALEDKFNVTFEAKNITWDDYQQKIQAWAASDSLPDIFAIDAIGTSNYFDWINDGLVAALPEDLSAYPNLNEYLNVEDIQTLKIDNQLYCIPRKTYPSTTWCANDRVVLYRWDLAQAAGVTKEPTTFDEYRDMIQKIIAADPQGKGVQGMTASGPYTLDGFLFTYSLPAAMSDASGSDYKWIKQDDGTWMPAYFAEDMTSTFQLARDMYQEGTIEADYALTKLQTAYDKFLTGQSAAILVAGTVQGQYTRVGKNWAEANDGRDFWDDVKVLNLLPGEDGTTTYPIFRSSWSESYISSNVDDAKLQRILAVYDYMVSEEGRTLLNMGFEGEDYSVDNGTYTSLLDGSIADKYTFKSLSELAEWNISTWNEEYPSVATDPKYREADLKRVAEAEKASMPAFDMRLTYMSTPLKGKFVVKPGEDLLKIMMGDQPVETMVNELMAEYEANGLSDMVAEVNAKATELGY